MYDWILATETSKVHVLGFYELLQNHFIITTITMLVQVMMAIPSISTSGRPGTCILGNAWSPWTQLRTFLLFGKLEGASSPALSWVLLLLFYLHVPFNIIIADTVISVKLGPGRAFMTYHLLISKVFSHSLRNKSKNLLNFIFPISCTIPGTPLG